MDIFCRLNLRDDCQKFIRILQISRNFVDYAKLVEMMTRKRGTHKWKKELSVLPSCTKRVQNFNGLKEIRQQTVAETYKYECY